MNRCSLRSALNLFPCVINKVDLGYMTVTHVSASRSLQSQPPVSEELRPRMDVDDDLCQFTAGPDASAKRAQAHV
jgi:hypothetical protein